MSLQGFDRDAARGGGHDHAGHEHAGHEHDETHDHGLDHHEDHGHHHGHGQDHDHDHPGGTLGWLKHTFAHSHDVHEKVDDAFETNERGIWALKISLAVLGITAILQV